ncbi:MAG: DUF2116 family Zn-ribbon domain-containing protein [Euryarchaeota archaeon]|nr:DUF2116 family Zn-ribbon domain-containing protein [Euryarchaeota archaeon]
MIEPHKHCMVCGKAIPTDKSFCSEKCEEHYRKRVKKQKMYSYLLMAVPIILIVLLIALGQI